MEKRKRKEMVKPVDLFPIVFETFRDLSGYMVNDLTRKEPSCFNGDVSVVKYRVTIERVEETKEVYEERLTKLWEECDNMHHYQPLKNKASALGVEIKAQFGSKRKK